MLLKLCGLFVLAVVAMGGAFAQLFNSPDWWWQVRDEARERAFELGERARDRREQARERLREAHEAARARRDDARERRKTLHEQARERREAMRELRRERRRDLGSFF